jgi:hypothetical protein
MLTALLVVALTADLPNANLPGNSPTLPNSNLPGVMPNDNPIYLPNSDTTPSVIQWGQPPGYWLPDGLPAFNPTKPLTPAEVQAIYEPQQKPLEEELYRAREDAAAARDEAARAREDAANAREDAADARDEAASLREESEQAAQQGAEGQPGAPGQAGAPVPTTAPTQPGPAPGMAGPAPTPQ